MILDIFPFYVAFPSISDNICTGQDHMSDTWVSYKKQELRTLHNKPVLTPGFFVGLCC